METNQRLEANEGLSPISSMSLTLLSRKGGKLSPVADRIRSQIHPPRIKPNKTKMIFVKYNKQNPNQANKINEYMK